MVHQHNLLVITINGGGLFIDTVYLLLFLIYSARKQRIKVLLILLDEIVFAGVLSALCCSIAIVGNIMMYAAPLSVMKLVIMTKSVEYIPFLNTRFRYHRNWKSKRSQLVKKKLVEERRSA
ncbi:putative SWEET sugar transporter [Helianthus debilis subsp. tardiflorus]